MIQFNLLPDVKLAYIKAQRSERMAISISVLAVAGAVVILIIVLGLVGWQKKSLSDLNRDIKKYSGQITSTPNLNKILTIQNQLNSLPKLDAQKWATDKVFTYISQLTPNQVTMSEYKLDFTGHTVDITGSASDLAAVNQLIDILKNATYTTGGSSVSKDAFSNVVLQSFGLSQQGSGATYEVTASFDPTIFNSSSNAKLSVPSKISTPSVANQPLFTGTNTNPNSKGQ